VVAVATPGTYAVLLTYEGGCTSRDSLLVNPAPLAPVFTLGADTTLCLEATLYLQAPAVSGPGVVYRWSDGSSGPSLLVQEPGQYSLQLTTPCDARTVSRRIAYKSCLFIPNIVTPNGDGRNDRFVINGLTRGPWALTIYNRWGREVYRNHDYRHDWGPEIAAGVYFYLLQQGPTRHKGTLEVVR
jgi:gliding motility-associated-like protein